MAPLADQSIGEVKAKKTIDWLGLWILISAWCSLSGWLLSLADELNRAGYSVALVLFVGALWFFRGSLGLAGTTLAPFRFRSLRSRWWLPRLWLALTVLALVGGLVYHPNNYDYLAYRFSRVLNWSWEQRWYWIDTQNIRMNLSAAGFEWLMMPLFVFFKTDRLFFLPNFISFLFLPGLVFSVFHRLGISQKISWWWMWVLPCGYCYILQAASVSNDMFATTYLLASFFYIYKAGEQTPDTSRNLFYSCLAIALTTGAKASNVPLVVPWAIAVWVNRGGLMKLSPVGLVASVALAAWISFLPIGLLNIRHTGSYTGDSQDIAKMQMSNPVAGLVGNSVLLTLDNLKPTVWPTLIPLGNVLPGPLMDYMTREYPRLGYKKYAFDQVQTEESSGVGIGVVACAVLMVVLRFWATVARPELLLRVPKKSLIIAAGAAGALLLLLTKLSSEAIPRLIAPYYILLVAGLLLLVSLDGAVIRFRVCKIFAGLSMLSVLVLIVVSPLRPLYPTEWAGAALDRVSPSLAERLRKVYEVYAMRYDGMRDLRLLLPDSEKSIGFIQTGDNLEAPLWRPYGSRQIIDVLPDQSLDQLKAKNIHLIIASRYALNYTYEVPLDVLLKKWSGRVVVEKGMLLRAASTPEVWYIIAVP